METVNLIKHEVGSLVLEYGDEVAPPPMLVEHLF